MIKISLDSDKFFKPGQKISGRVSWSELNQPERVDIRLIWYTTGKGDQNDDVVALQALEPVSENGYSLFEFIAPHRPFSFSGKLISLTWAIEVIAFPKMEAERVELVISKTGKDIVLTPVKEKSHKVFFVRSE